MLDMSGLGDATKKRVDGNKKLISDMELTARITSGPKNWTPTERRFSPSAL